MARAASSLTTYVALLRGINVGGKNRLAMKDLVALFAAAGATSLATYIQSGNVVFCARASGVTALVSAVETQLSARHGLDVPIVLRTGAEMNAVLEGQPFAAPGDDLACVHVSFLRDRPRAGLQAALAARCAKGERIVATGRDLYLYLPDGVARTKLTNAFIDGVTGTTSSLRNWRTVARLAEMAAPAQG